MTDTSAIGLRGELRYAVAFFGAHLSFIPLFALLLPRRVAAVAPGHAIALLSILLLAGGIAASVAHIAAGRFSDRWLRRHDDRRGVIMVGLAALAAAQLMLAFATSELALLAAIIAFQSGLNLMFAPLGALLADHVPDARKGRVAGWLNASLPLSSLGTTLAATGRTQEAVRGKAQALDMLPKRARRAVNGAAASSEFATDKPFAWSIPPA